MNAKKILIGLSTAMVFSSMAIAQPQQDNKTNSMQSHYNSTKAKHHRKGGHLKGAFMHLNLTKQQKIKIRDILRSKMQNRVKMSSAFSETGFDRTLYIKLSKQRKENMIQREADIVEAMYNVLTPQQKKKYRKMLDERENRMNRKK